MIKYEKFNQLYKGRTRVHAWKKIDKKEALYLKHRIFFFLVSNTIYKTINDGTSEQTISLSLQFTMSSRAHLTLGTPYYF